MNHLTPTDLPYVVRRIPKLVRELLQSSDRIFLGGGFIRDTIAGLPVKDVDLLGSSQMGLKAAAEELKAKYAADGGAKVVLHETDNAITLLAPPRTPVQFITRWTFDNPAAAMESFDFTVCQAVIFFGDGIWQSRCSERFYPDLAARRLVYTYPQREEEAGGSLMRVRKFLGRGWNIQADSLGGVVARLAQKIEWSKLSADRYDTKDGFEKAVGAVVAGLLREVDPLLIVNGLELIEDPGEGA
jgi:hypothetical protein